MSKRKERDKNKENKIGVAESFFFSFGWSASLGSNGLFYKCGSNSFFSFCKTHEKNIMVLMQRHCIEKLSGLWTYLAERN